MITRPRYRRLAFLLLTALALIWVSAARRPASLPVARAATPVAWEHKGFTLATWSENELYNSGPALEQLRQTGANHVTIVPNWYSPHQYSTDIYRTASTASDASLIWAIQRAKALGLKVMIKPHLDSQDGAWRANINPSNADLWFQNYATMINHYADLARTQGADGLSIGAELISMSTNPANESRWRSLIAGVRARFAGKLTYSANWGAGSFAEEFPRVPFWDALDYLGISAYFELATTNNPTVEQLQASWATWKTSKLIPFQQRWGKPVLFTEGGYRSVDGAARQPWNWGLSGALDTQEQVDLYEAFFQSFAGVPWFAGGEFWFWDVNANVSGTTMDYPVQNKPAYRTLSAWFGGPPGANPTPPPPTPPPSTPPPASNPVPRLTGLTPASAVAGGGGSATSYAIYNDSLASGWSNWSWSSNVNFSYTSAYSGSRAIRWRVDGAWGALYLHTDQAVQTGAGTSLRFALRAGGGGQQFQVAVYGSSNQQLGTPRPLSAVGGDPPAGTWKLYDIPLSSLGAAGQQISGFSLQEVQGIAQPAVDLDEISLTSPGTGGGGGGTAASPIYGDAPANGWSSWSWSSSINFAHPLAYSGSRAIWWRVDAPWGAFYLHTDQPVSTTSSTSLRFALRAGGSGQQLQLAVYGDANQQLGTPRRLAAVGGDPSPGVWKLYDVPLSSFGAAGQRISGFSLQEVQGTAQPPIELDEVGFAGLGAGGGTPATGLTLTVTGTNFVNGAVVRWNGANRTTTFVSATQLSAAIPATDLVSPGTASVTVVNPAPGGGVSNALSFAVTAP